MHDYLNTNRAMWDDWARLHVRSAFYDVAGFKAGRTALKSVELEELGEVAGRSLLHLQCHFGLDTLSWARLGARVTGIDFSGEAIRLARELAAELSIPATFICSDLYRLPEALEGQFDIVFTSYGVLPWLPDLRRWGEVVAHFLRPGGTFYIVEFHPISMIFESDQETHDWPVAYPYFSAEPFVEEVVGSYAEPEADVRHTPYEWAHTLGDTVSALAAAGLRIDFLHEFPYSTYGIWSQVEQREDGLWWPRQHAGSVPLLFSIRATRQA